MAILDLLKYLEYKPKIDADVELAIQERDAAATAHTIALKNYDDAVDRLQNLLTVQQLLNDIALRQV